MKLIGLVNESCKVANCRVVIVGIKANNDTMVSSILSDDVRSVAGQTQSTTPRSATTASDSVDADPADEANKQCSVPPGCWIAVLVISMALLGAGMLALAGFFIGSLVVGAFGVVLPWCLLLKRRQDDDEPVVPRPREQTIILVPNRMSKSEMERRLVPHESVTEECCEICLGEMTALSIDNKDIVRSPNPACSHVFHKKCILKWLRESLTCPCCRETYLPVTEQVVEEQGVATRGQEHDELTDEEPATPLDQEEENDPLDYTIRVVSYNLDDSDEESNDDEEFPA